MRKLFFLVLVISNFCQSEELGFWAQAKNDFVSPFYVPQARTTLLIGSAITTGFVATKKITVDPLQEDTVKKKPMGGYSKYGNISGQTYPNILYFVGMEAYSYFAEDSVAHDYAIVMLKSTLYSSLVTGTLKETVREERPGNPGDYTSFPSAHATRAFAFAGTVYTLHGPSWGIPAFALATAVAYSRMNDNRHYVHDVVAGATIGLSYAIALGEQYKNKHTSSDKEFVALPYDQGLMLSFKYSF